MNSTLQTIELLTKELRSLLPMKAEDQQRLDKKFRLEFNYNSNHLEGNTLTYSETALLLIFDDTKGNHTFREFEEMKAHDVAYEKVKEWAEDDERPLTEANIKNLNEIILVRPFWKDAITSDGQNTRRQIKVGNYKEHPNSVVLQNGEVFHYASPTDTPIQMGELVQWYREEEQKKELHPVQLAALFHYKFVRIHPFDDGNGRISRLLMNYVLLKNNLPPVIIKSEDKKNYLRALHLADVGDMEAFVNYVSAQLIWSLEISIKAAEGESVDEEGDLDKRIALLKKNIDRKDFGTEKGRLDVLSNIVERSIFPLIKELEEGLKKFDPLFIEREIYFDLQPYKIFNGQNLDKIFEDINFQKLFLERKELKQIGIAVGFNGLKNVDETIFIEAALINFTFLNRSYEMTISIGQKEAVSKSSEEYFTKREIDEIVSEVINSVYDKIEDIVNKKKK